MLTSALVIIGTGLGASIVWAFVIEPCIYRHLSKGGFVEPTRLRVKDTACESKI
jgi:hypothetical protein